MSAKPELSAGSGVQNVVVYVSNENFAQAYATVNHHQHHAPHPQPPQQHHHPNDAVLQQQHQHQNGIPVSVSVSAFAEPKMYKMATSPATMPIGVQQMQQVHVQPPPTYYSAGLTPQHQHHHPHPHPLNGYDGHGGGKEEVEDDVSKEEYELRIIEPPTMVMTAEQQQHLQVVHQQQHQHQQQQQQQRSCDSVRSDAAESSCSSLSSMGDDTGVLVIPDQMGAAAAAAADVSSAPVLVYDHSSAVNVRQGVVVVGANHHVLGDNQVVLQQQHHQQYQRGVVPSIAVPAGWKRLITNGVVIYVSPSNTALRSLEHIKEYLLTPDTCKCGLECPLRSDLVFNFDPKVASKGWTFTPDTSNCNHKRKYMQHQKDCNQPTIKRKKTKLATKPPSISMGQPLHILPQQAPPQFVTKDNNYTHGPSQATNSHHHHHHNHHQQQQQQQQVIATRYLTAQDHQIFEEHHQQQPPVPPMVQIANPNISGGHPQHHHHQLRPQMLIPVPTGSQRVFVNNGQHQQQPSEPSGPGRPLMIPVSLAAAASSRPLPNGQIYQRQLVPNGFRAQLPIQHHQQKVLGRIPVQAAPSPMNNIYERVPPLPNQLLQQVQHPVQVQVWPEEMVQRKKLKSKAKKQRFVDGMEMRQMQFHSESTAASPSFLDDPSGYLAQQTALLNSTINRQAEVSEYICNSPQPSGGVPLPTNMKPYRQQQLVRVKVNSFPSHSADSATTPDAEKRAISQPGTPDSVTSSSTAYAEKHSPDSRPIQGGIVSTSNVSPVAIEGDDSGTSATSGSPTQEPFYMESHPSQIVPQTQLQYSTARGVVTTMASGRTVGSNTITSVLAGRANTATVSITNPPLQPQSIPPHSSRSPLEMVQSVVSSIKLPHPQSSQNQTISVQNIPQQIVQKGLPPGHILVSSGGQLIMASTNANHSPQPATQQQMPPPPPKLHTSMPPMSVSPMITNVTASVTQMIPAVAQQVLGQQTVLVNALPGPFVLQPSVTMTMDGINQLQLQPQIVTGNVIQQQLPNLVSAEKAKKSKKRKAIAAPPQQTLNTAPMLQIAAQPSSSPAPNVVGFPQQIQMHSPQSVMQALTIMPGKAGGGTTHQFVMNHQNTAQLLNSQSQPINLLQPVNLAQGMVQNFPTIQQFVLPTNLTGMVMNADGTATIVQQDHSPNIGMQLQLQNVNGQNVLTPVQTNNQMFVGANGQVIPGGMVLRPQGKIIHQQQHSPGAQFLSPTSGGQFVAQFNGQLSPLVASVSPGQQVTFSPQIRPSTVQQSVQQPEFICGQTLMVPANIAAANQASNQQNTTFVQQNTTIVQQQTTMMSNQNNGQHQQQQGGQQHQRSLEGFVVSSDKQQQQQQNIHTVLVASQQRHHNSPPSQLQQQINYRNSVSTQTAMVNGHSQSVTTFCQTSTSNTSAGSPPDTTTLSPLAAGGQSPPTADTTTHTGEGLSPAPSMVHCVSSSEPDSAAEMLLDAEQWRKVELLSSGDVRKTRVAFAESSTMVHYDTTKSNMRGGFERPKRKHSDTLIVMETTRFDDDDDDADDDEEVVAREKQALVEGDLVWGPARGYPAWPGKLMRVHGPHAVCVRWFGVGGATSDLDPAVLQTLTEGLDAHHRASRRSRTGRKLNPQLEKAIQEAMAELDRGEEASTSKCKKSSGRLRSSRQAS